MVEVLAPVARQDLRAGWGRGQFEEREFEEWLASLEENEGDAFVEDERVDVDVALNSKSPEEIADAITRFGYWPMRAAMLNPNTPPSVLVTLTSDGDIFAPALFGHPNANAEVYRAAMGRIDQTDDPDDIKSAQAICGALLGIDERNTGALELVMVHDEWWKLSPQSREVELALHVHANP